jgi:hypothetical protein
LTPMPTTIAASAVSTERRSGRRADHAIKSCGRQRARGSEQLAQRQSGASSVCAPAAPEERKDTRDPAAPDMKGGGVVPVEDHRIGAAPPRLGLRVAKARRGRSAQGGGIEASPPSTSRHELRSGSRARKLASGSRRRRRALLTDRRRGRRPERARRWAWAEDVEGIGAGTSHNWSASRCARPGVRLGSDRPERRERTVTPRPLHIPPENAQVIAQPYDEMRRRSGRRLPVTDLPPAPCGG